MKTSLRFLVCFLGALVALSPSRATPTYTTIHNFTDAGGQAIAIVGSDGILYVAAGTMGSNGAGQIFRIATDGTGYAVVKSFPSVPDSPLIPNALVEGVDGVLYGTSQNGGVGTNNGTVYRVNKDGTGFAILHSFATISLGTSPTSLMQASDGALYGTTSLGGSSSKGVLFKIATDGTGYTVLKNFSTNQGRALTEGPGGALYWSVQTGGTYGYGLLVKMNKDGTGYTVLKNFAGGSDGATPRAGLLAASDGKLYGTTYVGGSAGRGTAFQIASDGTGYTVLHNFLGSSTDGGAVYAPLHEGPDGMLYGTTFAYGSGGRGTVYRMNKDGSSYAVLKNFSAGTTDGGTFIQGVVLDSSGTVYGVNGTGGGDTWGLLFKMNADGTGFSVLKDFGAPDGSLLLTTVTEASDGALYGSTYLGGGSGKGTLYKVNKDGTGYTVLHRFAATSDGAQPSGLLIEASDSKIYGTTLLGNPASGILFRIEKDGTGYTVVHSFGGTGDGAGPLGGVVEGTDGKLYGTTNGGGAYGGGAVFRINKDGTGLTLLRSFAASGTDGRYPYAGLIDAGGILYGTTSAGGTAGNGTVFKIAEDGTGYAVLHHFAGGTSDGAAPSAPVYLASDGRLYGTTVSGGSSGLGTVFGLNTDGSSYAIIKHFAGGTSDGAVPYYGGVVELSGLLYGGTNGGGSFGGGTLFQVAPDGSSYAVLVNLGVDESDGRVGGAGMTVGSDGLLYGVTAYGDGGGTVFSYQTY